MAKIKLHGMFARMDFLTFIVDKSALSCLFASKTIILQCNFKSVKFKVMQKMGLLVLSCLVAGMAHNALRASAKC